MSSQWRREAVVLGEGKQEVAEDEGKQHHPLSENNLLRGLGAQSQMWTGLSLVPRTTGVEVGDKRKEKKHCMLI